MASPEAQFPIGFRFHPTEEELVGHYLKRKLAGDESVNDTIAEVDVCKVEPWDLPALSKVKSDDSWFFFSPRGLKYTNSNRSNRKTMAGYWKATGKDRKIKTRGTNNVIGIKKTLVFYEGRVSPGVRTNWVIHEYHLNTSRNFQKIFVLCRLMEKIEKKVKGKGASVNGQKESSNSMASDYENQALSGQAPNDFLPEVDMDSIPQEVEYDSTLIQQEPSFRYASVSNVYDENKDNSNKFSFEATEVGDNFDEFLNSNNFETLLNSVIINEDTFFSEERSMLVPVILPHQSYQEEQTLS